MQIRITTRHGNVSEDTQAKVQAKVEKLTRYFDRLTEIVVKIDLERREEPRVDLKVSAKRKHDFVATAQGEDLMASVDLVIHRLERQIRRHKEKIQERHRNTPPRKRGSLDVVDGNETTDESD